MVFSLFSPLQTSLLVLDPGVSGGAYAASFAAHTWPAKFRRGLAALKRRDYQLVYCAGVFASPAARERAKNIAAAETHGTRRPTLFKGAAA